MDTAQKQANHQQQMVRIFNIYANHIWTILIISNLKSVQITCSIKMPGYYSDIYLMSQQWLLVWMTSTRCRLFPAAENLFGMYAGHGIWFAFLINDMVATYCICYDGVYEDVILGEVLVNTCLKRRTHKNISAPRGF